MSVLRRAWRRSRVVRPVAVVYLLVFAAVSAMLAFGALSYLWADYRDSSMSTYLLIGLPALAGSLATFLAAVSLWQDR